LLQVVGISAMSLSGGKATRTSGVVGDLSDEVLTFRGERVGRRAVALRLSTTLAPPLPVRKTDLRVARLRVSTAQIALTASPRAKSGGARETELREPQSGAALTHRPRADLAPRPGSRVVGAPAAGRWFGAQRLQALPHGRRASARTGRRGHAGVGRLRGRAKTRLAAQFRRSASENRVRLARRTGREGGDGC